MGEQRLSTGQIRLCSCELTRGMNHRHKSWHMLARGHEGTANSRLYPGRGGEGEVTLIKLVAYENGVMPIGRM